MWYLYLLCALGVTCLIRMLPLLLLRRPLRSRFLRSFLYYVPYVTLSVMIFPAMLYQTSSVAVGAITLAVGILLAWRFRNLFVTAIGTCAAALLLSLFL